MAKKVFVSSADTIGPVDFEALGEAIDRARLQTRARLAKDPEWTLQRWTSTREILRAFCYGVLQADQWHRGYRMPFGFEEVANHLAAAIEETYGGEEIVLAALLEIDQVIERALLACVTWRAWGGDPGAILLITHQTPHLMPERVPMDLEAVRMNAMVLIRDLRRQEDERTRAAKEQTGK